MSSRVSQKAVSCSRTALNWLLTSSFLLLGGCVVSISDVTRIKHWSDSAGDLRDHIKKICSDELVSRCKPIWGLDSEGEIIGAWRNFGVPNMWYMMGQFSPFSFGFRDDDIFFFFFFSTCL